ncbi:MAG: hypothetical protein OEY56_02975 [Cyclobacteriaceae bacterium]|nr:hypothetical protein [Cyclobacteriaceae bacterium]
MKKLTLLICLAFGFSARAQINFDTFLEGGLEDANTLLENYLEPVFVGIGYDLNSGWYNTGKPHKILGLDLTVQANLAFVPQDARFFTFNNADYTLVQLAPGSSDQLPTLLGPNLPADNLPELVFNPDDPITSVRITAPTGAGIDEKLFGMNPVPLPVAQMGIGLIKNTELKLRIIPERTFGDPGAESRVKLFGIGVMHDVKQWIPGMKLLPFDLSAFAGYTRFNTSIALNNQGTQYSELTVGGTTFQAIISKKISVATAYAGLGVITTSSNFNMTGTFDTQVGSFTDPIAFDYAKSGARANVGARVKLAIFTIHAEYAIQHYNTLTVGLGLSVR